MPAGTAIPSSLTGTFNGNGSSDTFYVVGGASGNRFGNVVLTEPTGATPTLDQLFFSINEALTELTALGPAGGFGASVATFTALLGTGGKPSTATAVAACFRAALIDQHVGE